MKSLQEMIDQCNATGKMTKGDYALVSFQKFKQLQQEQWNQAFLDRVEATEEVTSEWPLMVRLTAK